MNDIPKNLQARPVINGFILPWFVDETIDPIDFRVSDQRKIFKAHRQALCWICGKRRDPTFSFVIGPMCSINRISAEPPAHHDCAMYSVTHCPFLSRPQMKRSPRDLPVDKIDPPGNMLLRNPGVVAIWVTKDYETSVHPEGLLFHIGDPLKVQWFRQGQTATRSEVLESIDKGFPLLMNAALNDGLGAIQELQVLRQRAMRYVPLE